MPIFNAIRFLTGEIGSMNNVLALFSQYGLGSPSPAAIEKWFQRGVIPSRWLPILICLVELDRGEPVRLAQYLSTEET